jgi:hypothetical protein
LGVKYGGRKDGPWIFLYMLLFAAAYHEGNTGDENNGYVVFKEISTDHRVAVMGGGVTPSTLSSLYSRLLDRYLKTT